MAYSTDSSLAQNHVVISEDLRSLTIPAGQEILGAVGDDSVRKVYFDCPQYCDGTDMSDFAISVHYQNSDGEEDRYDVTESTVADGVITFWWLVGRTACSASGKTEASVKLRKLDGDVVLKEFNSGTGKWVVLHAL